MRTLQNRKQHPQILIQKQVNRLALESRKTPIVPLSPLDGLDNPLPNIRYLLKHLRVFSIDQ